MIARVDTVPRIHYSYYDHISRGIVRAIDIIDDYESIISMYVPAMTQRRSMSVFIVQKPETQ